MHFEIPKAKSIKEFGGEYLMIVISIITALTLEHAAQSVYHQKVAGEAGERIENEIRSNIGEIDAVLLHNKLEVVKLTRLRRQFLDGILAKGPEAALMARLTGEFRSNFSFSIRSAALRKEAWDVAVANQSISWMNADAVRRYSMVYAAMRDVQAIAGGGGTEFLDGPRMGDVISNMQMGIADPVQVYRMLNQVISAYNSMDGNLESLQIQLKEAEKPA